MKASDLLQAAGILDEAANQRLRWAAVTADPTWRNFYVQVSQQFTDRADEVRFWARSTQRSEERGNERPFDAQIESAVGSFLAMAGVTDFQKAEKSEGVAMAAQSAEAALKERRLGALRRAAQHIVRDLVSQDAPQKSAASEEQDQLSKQLGSVLAEIVHLERTDEPRLEQEAAHEPLSFADRVFSIATRLTTPPFTDHVPIADVYDAYGRIYPDAGRLANFKARLIQAADRQEIPLGQFKSPQDMDDELRWRSTVQRTDGTEVHFICTGREYQNGWRLSNAYLGDLDRRQAIENSTMLLAIRPVLIGVTDLVRHDLATLSAIRAGTERDAALLAMGNSGETPTAYGAELARQAPKIAVQAGEAYVRAMNEWDVEQSRAYAATGIPLWPDVDVNNPADLSLPPTQRALHHNAGAAYAGQLSDAGTDEVEFQRAFESMRSDPAFDGAMACQVALAYAGEDGLQTKEAALGAIERHFYAKSAERQDEQDHTVSQGGGR